MCGISGFLLPEKPGRECALCLQQILQDMNQSQKRRGPDDEGVWLSGIFGLAQVRLEIVDLVTGHQPLLNTIDGHTWGITYNGELYNTDELRQELKALGHTFETSSDTEVILTSYLEFGPEFVKKTQRYLCPRHRRPNQAIPPSLPGPAWSKASFLWVPGRYLSFFFRDKKYPRLPWLCPCGRP